MQRTVNSADGTPIVYEQHGTGTPIVCLHGTGVTREMWYGIAGELADEAAVIAVDRRGRGESGDTEPYAFEREREDVESVIDSLDEEPILVGSSFGGLLALTVAQTRSIASLALYEPPLPALTIGEGESLAARMEDHLNSGEREAAVKLFFTEAAGAEHVEHWPIWPACVDLAETMVRECRIVESFDLDGIDISVPTLLFTGEYSPAYLQEGIAILDGQIADSRVVTIEGAGHAGVATASAQVAEALSAELL